MMRKKSKAIPTYRVIRDGRGKYMAEHYTRRWTPSGTYRYWEPIGGWHDTLMSCKDDIDDHKKMSIRQEVYIEHTTPGTS